LIFYTDSVVISLFLPISAVTFFAIAGNLMNYSRGILSGISTTLSPLASSLEVEGNGKDLVRVLLKGSRFASMVFLPIGITFLIRGRSFIALWMGPSYAALSGEVLVILTAAQLIMAGNYVPTSMSIGISKHKGAVPAILLEGLSNVVLSIALVRSYGVIGVALGTALPNLATNLFFWPWYIRRTFGIRPVTYAWSTWIHPGLAALPYAAGTYLIEKWWPASDLFMFLIQTFFVLPIALLGFWFLCVTPAERNGYCERFLRPLLSARESV
jgi:O-antigen/teichoic acid export membrane protein